MLINIIVKRWNFKFLGFINRKWEVIGIFGGKLYRSYNEGKRDYYEIGFYLGMVILMLDFRLIRVLIL